MELMSFSLIHDLNSLTAKAGDTPDQRQESEKWVLTKLSIKIYLCVLTVFPDDNLGCCGPP